MQLTMCHAVHAISRSAELGHSACRHQLMSWPYEAAHRERARKRDPRCVESNGPTGAPLAWIATMLCLRGEHVCRQALSEGSANTKHAHPTMNHCPAHDTNVHSSNVITLLLSLRYPQCLQALLAGREPRALRLSCEWSHDELCVAPRKYLCV